MTGDRDEIEIYNRAYVLNISLNRFWDKSNVIF